MKPGNRRPARFGANSRGVQAMPEDEAHDAKCVLTNALIL
jgi:hypothetical protein